MSTTDDDGSSIKVSWIRNCQTFASNSSTPLIVFIYVTLITAFLILCHSFYLHRFKVTTVRFLSDASCWSSIFACPLLLYAIQHPSRTNTAIMIDFLVYGIFGTTVQLSDNYITYFRFLSVVPRTSSRMKIFINLYIWILMVFTYFFYDTLIPAFVDENTDSFARVNLITAGYIFMISYISFNIYFGYQFYAVVHQASTVEKNKKVVLLGYKNIIHIIISTIGVVLQGTESAFNFAPGGCMASYFTVNIAIHFLFNWKPGAIKPKVDRRNSNISSSKSALDNFNSRLATRLSGFVRQSSNLGNIQRARSVKIYVTEKPEPSQSQTQRFD